MVWAPKSGLIVETLWGWPVDYLNLEFGAYEESQKVTANDLNYIGVNTSSGKKYGIGSFRVQRRVVVGLLSKSTKIVI